MQRLPAGFFRRVKHAVCSCVSAKSNQPHPHPSRRWYAGVSVRMTKKEVSLRAHAQVIGSNCRKAMPDLNHVKPKTAHKTIFRAKKQSFVRI